MLNFYLVAVHELTSKVTIDFVKIQTVVTCDEGLHEFDVLAYLVDITGASRIVACCLNTTTQGIVALKTDHIIGLPAMQGDLLLLKLVKDGVSIDTDGCIAIFRYGISFFD